MSPNNPNVRTHAVVKLIARGDKSTAEGVAAQISYISQDGEVPVFRSDRYFDQLPLQPERFPGFARDWESQAAVYPGAVQRDGRRRGFTTHIVVSLPPGFGMDLDEVDAARARAGGQRIEDYRTQARLDLAHQIMRDYAYEVFGSGNNGGRWDYVTAFHTNRGHPHLHIVVNRASHEGHWMKISRRHPHLNYDNLRAIMSRVALRHGVNLDHTTRLERGIIARPVTDPQWRRRMQSRVDVFPQDEEEGSANDGNPLATAEELDAARRRLNARRAGAAAAARARSEGADDDEFLLGADDDDQHADEGEEIEGDDQGNDDDRDAQQALRRQAAALRRAQERANLVPNVETRAARLRRETHELDIRLQNSLQLRSGTTVDRSALVQRPERRGNAANRDDRRR